MKFWIHLFSVTQLIYLICDDLVIYHRLQGTELSWTSASKSLSVQEHFVVPLAWN